MWQMVVDHRHTNIKNLPTKTYLRLIRLSYFFVIQLWRIFGYCCYHKYAAVYVSRMPQNKQKYLNNWKMLQKSCSLFIFFSSPALGITTIAQVRATIKLKNRRGWWRNDKLLSTTFCHVSVGILYALGVLEICKNLREGSILESIFPISHMFP